MNFKHLLSSRPRSYKKPHRARLAVEILEGRHLLAALMFATQPIATSSGSVLKGMAPGSNDVKPIEIKIDNPAMAGSAPVTIALASNPGGGQLGGTVTRPLVNGKVSFDNLFIFGDAPDQGKRGYTLVAFAGSLDPAFSNSFVVRPGATALHFAADLGTAEAGKGLKDTTDTDLEEIVVQALDPNGGLARDAQTAQLTLFLDKNPGGARFVHSDDKLAANPTATLTNGIARFKVKGLGIDKAGIGYTLGVEAVNNALLASGHSNPFVVTATIAAGVKFREPLTVAFANRLLNATNGRLSNSFLGVTVQVVDRYGNPVTSGPGATATVTLSLNDNPNLLQGTKSKPAVNGIARFEDLLLQQAGNYTLLASGMVGMTTLTYPVSETPFTFTVQDANPDLLRLRFVTAASAKKFPLGGRLDPIEVEVLKTDGGARLDNSTLRVTLDGSGLISGTLTVTVKNGVARFDDIFLRGASLGGNPDLTLTAGFEDLPLPVILPANGLKIHRTAGQPAVLRFVNTVLGGLAQNGSFLAANVTAGTRIVAPGGAAVQVRVEDAFSNPVPNAPLQVALGVLRTGGNPDVTLLANDPDLGNASKLGVYATGMPDANGIVTFGNLYINRASDKYKLSVGTASGFLSPDTTAEFNVVVGKADRVQILGAVNDVGSRRRITSNVTLGVLVSVSDKVGNTVTTDSTTEVLVRLDPSSPNPNSLQSTTLTVRNGLALFDRLYVDQTEIATIEGYKLKATVAGLPNPDFASNAFKVLPPPNVPATPPAFAVKQEPPQSPLTVTPNSPFTFSFLVGTEGANTYDADGQVFVELVDVNGVPVPPNVAVLEGGQNTAKPKNGVVTFDFLKIKAPGMYKIRAILELFALEAVTKQFTVGTSQPGGALNAPAAQAAGAALPGAIRDVGLGSITENFDFVSSLDAYGKLANGMDKPNDQLIRPPSDAPNPNFTPVAAMQQPNVTPSDFSQVAVTNKWWSSLMFQRSTAQGTDERNAQDRVLFPMFPNPLATMVNGAGSFAGLGLAHLTNRFVQPSFEFLDPSPKPAALPDGRFPANTGYFFNYDNGVINDARGYQDFAIGLGNLPADASTDATVLRYSDWTATFDWGGKLEATLGEGLPFVYFLAKNIDPNNLPVVRLQPNQKLVADADGNLQNVAQVAFFDSKGMPVALGSKGTGPLRLRITYTVPDQILAQDPDDPQKTKPIRFDVTVDNWYGLFLPSDREWTISPSGVVDATLTAEKNYFSTAALTDGTQATFEFFRQRAYSFVTGSASSFHFDEATGQLLTTFVLQTPATMKETGPDLVNRPVQALYVNQWQNLAANSPVNTAYTYVSPRGTMKVFDGAVFATELFHRGTLPLVPPVLGDTAGTNTFHADLWRNQLLPFLQNVSSIGQADGSLRLDRLLPTLPTNNYLEGQAMLGAIQLVPILLEVADSKDPNLTAAERQQARAYAERVFQLVKDHMSDWLSAKDDENLRLFYYQPRQPNEAEAKDKPGIGWQSIVGLPDGFLSSESLNDHHLITGYFLKTAAILAQYDRYWGDSSQRFDNGDQTLMGKLGEIINLMVRDVSNYNRNDPTFPFLRNFDVYEGHSWADGAANDRHGTNQESASEALNYASGLIQWGEAIGDVGLRNLGIYLYNTEIEAFNTYYFNVNGTDAFPDDFRLFRDANGQQQERPSIAFLHNGQAVWGGFIGSIRSRLLGIQVLPLTGGSYYLGRDPAFVAKNFAPAEQPAGQRQEGEVPPAPSSYLSVIYPYLAFSDPHQALGLYQAELDKNNVVPVNPNVPIDNAPFNLHWIRVLEEYGHVDPTVSADIVSYQAFIKGTNRTLVAYNPDAFERPVTFKADGAALFTRSVPGRTTIVLDAAGNEVTRQTTPDFSFQTPQNRFFFSGSTADNLKLLHGLPGTGEQAVDIPVPGDGTFPNIPHDALTFQITGVTGTLRSSLASRADFSLWLDPTFLPTTLFDPTITNPPKKIPFIQIQVTYDVNGDGKDLRLAVYGGTGLSSNPGLVQAWSLDGSLLAPNVNPAPNLKLPAELNNGTITVQIWAREGTDRPIRLRTDAAAEQGRVSYIDFPYDFSRIDGKAVDQLILPVQFVTNDTGSQGTPTFLAGATGVAAPDGAGHTYTAHLSLDGRSATFTGNASSDLLVFDTERGLLRHNRFTAGDPGFVSDLDFDSSQPGEQTLAADRTSHVAVDTGAGVDHVVLGTETVPASALRARFTITNGDAGNDRLTINDGGADINRRFTVSNSAIWTGDDTLYIQVVGPVFGGGIALTTGTGVNTVKVLATRAGESLTLDTRDGLDVVTVGDGSVQNIRGSVVVRNTNAFSDLVLDNSRAANFAGIVTISASSVTGLAPAAISFAGADLDDLEVYGGTTATTYQVTGSLPGTFLFLDVGDGDDVFVIGNHGRVDDASFGGKLLFDGGTGKKELRFDNSAGSPKHLATSPRGLVGLLGTEVSVSDIAKLTVSLGPGSDTVTVVDALPGIANLTLRTGGGGDQITIVPQLVTTIDLDGGAPVVAPGDRLSVQSSTVSAPKFESAAERSGRWTFANAQPINFVDVESVNPEVYVRALYRTVLGREAEAAGFTRWVSFLEAGGTRLRVVQGFWESPEHRGIQVDQFYSTYLHRAADPTGHAAWVHALLNGMSEAEVARGFLTSDEYREAHASTTAYLFGLYADVLGRAPDPNGLDAWQRAVQEGLGRRELADRFLHSREAEMQMVARNYANYLDRDGEAAGVASWLDTLQSRRHSPAEVAEAFVASDEFFARAAV